MSFALMPLINLFIPPVPSISFQLLQVKLSVIELSMKVQEFLRLIGLLNFERSGIHNLAPLNLKSLRQKNLHWS